MNPSINLVGGEGLRRDIMHVYPVKKSNALRHSTPRWTVPHPEFSTVIPNCDNRMVITYGLSVTQRVHYNPPKPKLLTMHQSRGLSQQRSPGLRNGYYRTKVLRMTDLGHFSYSQCSARRPACQGSTGSVSQDRRGNNG